MPVTTCNLIQYRLSYQHMFCAVVVSGHRSFAQHAAVLAVHHESFISMLVLPAVRPADLDKAVEKY
jgi:hypothetical protein